MRRRLFSMGLGLVLLSCGGAEEKVETPAGPAVSAQANPVPAKSSGDAVVQKAPKVVPREDKTLIPREVLFGNPDKTGPRISPDGKRLMFLAAVDGIMNVWVGPANDINAAKPVTQEKERNIRRVFWAYTNDHILYANDKKGDENWHVFSVDLKNNNALKDLTPIDGVAAQIENLSHKVPDEVTIGLNDRDKKSHDLYRINIKTGDKKLLQKNEAGYAEIMTDSDYKVRLAMLNNKDGSTEYFEPDAKGGFKSFLAIPFEDSQTTSVLGFNTAGDKLYVIDSRQRDTAALTWMDMKARKPTVSAQDAKADIQGVVMHPKDNTVQAAISTYERPVYHVTDNSIKADIDYLLKAEKGDLNILSRSLDGKWWTVAYNLDNGPVNFYLYESGKKPKSTFLFSHQKALMGLPLTNMHARVIPSRDKLSLVNYLSLPKASDPDGNGVPDKPLPMVLLVHGGPWARDMWGFNSMHQWLANRGYAVLSVNYRGSTGFGKAFINASNKEWAGKMHDDLIDSVNWAVDQKIADKSKVAIMGGSYGGYATLVGLTFTPETFACGVDIVGPSNLMTLLQTIPPYWAPMIEMFTKRVGDHRTEEGRAFLNSRSPLNFVDKIQRPLLIGQGANDPRVKQSESDQIVKAMTAKNIPVTYVLFSNEGHGFAQPENRKAFNAVAEVFLAQCLGGGYEPVGSDFKGSSIEVPNGADEVYGLKNALTSKGK